MGKIIHKRGNTYKVNKQPRKEYFSDISEQLRRKREERENANKTVTQEETNVKDKSQTPD